jgi:hypothetical protein
MSMFTKLPSEFYDATAFDGFSPDRDFHLGTAKAMAWLSQLAYETDEPKKIEAILRIWKLRLVEEVISTELRSVLPMASTHAFVAAGRGATFITFAGTDPVVLANWISDFDTHLTSTGVAEGYAEAASIVLGRIRAIATKRQILDAGVSPKTKFSVSETNRSRTQQTSLLRHAGLAKAGEISLVVQGPYRWRRPCRTSAARPGWQS